MKRGKTNGNKARLAAALLGGLICLVGPVSPGRTCEVDVVWKADLASVPPAVPPDSNSPSIPNPPSGTASIAFDFVHPGATVQVDTKNLRDVRAVELHVFHSYTDHTGPTVLTIYSATAGQLPGTLTKRMTEADLRKQTDPKISAFPDLVQAVLDGRTYVSVTTKAHPQGELSGTITMRKDVLFSDNPADAVHDPALHQAAQTAPHP